MTVFAPRITGWLAAVGAFVAALAVLSTAVAEGPGPAGPAIDASRLRVAGAQLERGREAYDFHCTTCHGATGAGFAEARAAFPADHYDCSRCHGPGNPPVMSRSQIEATQTVFSLGRAPALDAGSTIDRFGSADRFFAHVRATMPRWSPGRLDDETYLDLVVYVLSLAYDVDAGGDALGLGDLERIELPPPDSPD